MTVHGDPEWPRATSLLTERSDVECVFVGVPAHETSISATSAHRTPAAVRLALEKYSTYCTSHGRELAPASIHDLGDIEQPDHVAGEARVAYALRQLTDRIVIAIGGDNSITYSVMAALCQSDLPNAGLITLDAHHDLRDGVSNGSPVRRLIDAGLPGSHVVQIGIADFSNSPFYARRARDFGITVVPRSNLRTTPMTSVVSTALEVAGSGGGPIHVDIDMDVCDRAVVPGCPAAAPGGISADELRQFVYLLGCDPRVRSIDFTEVDAEADSSDARTTRLIALCLLEFLCAVQSRT